MRLAWLAVASVVAAAGCDAKSGASAEATLEGTVAGRTIASPGATATSARSVLSPASTAAEIAVHVAEGATTCGALDAPSGAALDLRVHVEGANVPPLTPGDFAIGHVASGADLVIAEATFALGGDAGPAAVAAARSGSITLTSIAPSAIAGRFDLVFVTGDHLTGTFDARVCSGATVPGEPGDAAPAVGDAAPDGS